MDERQDVNLCGRHLVEQAVSLNKHFAHIRLVELWNDTTSLTVDIERGSGIESLDQQTLSGRP
jgi:hypothetical protein